MNVRYPHPQLTTRRCYHVVYPSYRALIDGLTLVPLSGRSLIIKACQAQKWPSPGSFSTLRRMLESHPPVLIKQGTLMSLPLCEFIPFFQITLEDPLESAIVLDICRGLPLSTHAEVEEAKRSSWGKEISLALGLKKESEVNWDIFFDGSKCSERMHPDLEPNPSMARKIHFQLGVFRSRITGRRLFPRATHKNMSRATRRQYESYFGSIEDVPIFGQDNWGYVYHHHGIMLEGASEMRQKWYHHAAKPRTYFAMGGEAYRDCRFLQDFFTDLVNHFIPTNQKTRLHPERLFMSSEDEKEDPHFRIYDLSSFTSNMSEQLPFMRKLVEWFRGVEVECVDERHGPVCRDLGELLEIYTNTCVEEPTVSLERYPDFNGMEADDLTIPHCVASLLGIFGNLMTCTLAHYFIISPVLQNEEEGNVAGDDGIIPEDSSNPFPVQRVISLVGSCAMEKTFRSDEEAAICLKRPLEEHLPRLQTFFNIIPPSVTRFFQLSKGRDPDDSRYAPVYEDYTPSQVISIIGKDLLRFLRSAYLREFSDTDRLTEVVKGFENLVKSRYGISVRPSAMNHGIGYVWPMHPCRYEFLDCPPSTALGLYYLPDVIHVCKMGHLPTETRYLYPGMQFQSNSTRRLKMLESYGYVTKEEVKETYHRELAMNYYQMLLSPVFIPNIYEYVVVAEVPESFQMWY